MNNPRIIELKARELNGKTKWEDLPIIERITVYSDAGADEKAFLRSYQLGKEIRWNYQGYSEGHYVVNDIAFTAWRKQ
jgi:hypothetical protein